MISWIDHEAVFILPDYSDFEIILNINTNTGNNDWKVSMNWDTSRSVKEGHPRIKVGSKVAFSMKIKDISIKTDIKLRCIRC